MSELSAYLRRRDTKPTAAPAFARAVPIMDPLSNICTNFDQVGQVDFFP
jgi:hypothetical protein